MDLNTVWPVDDKSLHLCFTPMTTGKCDLIVTEPILSVKIQIAYAKNRVTHVLHKIVCINQVIFGLTPICLIPVLFIQLVT